MEEQMDSMGRHPNFPEENDDPRSVPAPGRPVLKEILDTLKSHGPSSADNSYYLATYQVDTDVVMPEGGIEFIVLTERGALYMDFGTMWQTLPTHRQPTETLARVVGPARDIADAAEFLQGKMLQNLALVALAANAFVGWPVEV